MSKLLSQILLAVLMFPSAGLIWFAGFHLLDRRPGVSYVTALHWAGVKAGLFVVAYWVMLWGKLVRWTAFRIAVTLALLPVCAIGAMIVFLRSDFYVPSVAASIISVGAACLTWLIGTTLIWRETTRERAERVRATARGAVVCPTCGYNLTGLREARCPECGSSFTLDELMAGQPAAAGVELER
jgi:hypothetical protein